MVGFDRIVGVLLDVVPRRRQQLVENGRVDRRGVGDHFGRDDFQRVEGLGKESVGRGGVAADAQQHVDDLATLVNGPVDVAPHAVDLDVVLVYEPAVARRMAGESSGVG